MDVFRLAGDFSHSLSFIILLVRLWKTKSCEGISGKTQVLFGLVFTTRYLDLFVYYISLYNHTFKIVFILATYLTIYLIYFKFKKTYDRTHDTLRIEFLLVPAFLLSVFINHGTTALEILWTFSIYLEAVAILPQLFMVYKTGEIENITVYYLVAFGSYRALYILHWIYRYLTENTYDLIAIVAGVVQTILNFIFIVYVQYIINQDGYALVNT